MTVDGVTKLMERLTARDITLIRPLKSGISMSRAFAELHHIGRAAKSGIICQQAMHPSCASLRHRFGNVVEASKLRHQIKLGHPSYFYRVSISTSRISQF